MSTSVLDVDEDTSVVTVDTSTSVLVVDSDLPVVAGFVLVCLLCGNVDDVVLLIVVNGELVVDIKLVTVFEPLVDELVWSVPTTISHLSPRM